MSDKALINGLVVLAAGFLASGVSSFLEQWAILGSATDFVNGLFAGLSAVAFCVAIFVLVRSRRTTQESDWPLIKPWSRPRSEELFGATKRLRPRLSRPTQAGGRLPVLRMEWQGVGEVMNAQLNDVCAICLTYRSGVPS